MFVEDDETDLSIVGYSSCLEEIVEGAVLDVFCS
jgi:hypothetical protein